MFRMFAFTLLAAALAAPAQAQNCSREDLRAVISDYFDAVGSHDLSRLETASDLRVTENGQEIEPGQGFFLTGGAVQFQRSLIDTERCGTLTQAVIDETANGETAPVILAVRLQVDGGDVSEIETIITRTGELFFSPEGLLETRDHDWEGILPPEERSTREYMNQAANSYFDGFSAELVEAPFADPCHRWEGGVQTTANTGNCSAQGLVLNHTHRRFPVTDLEAGITAGFINFGGSLPDVHMFKFRGGEIHLIQAVFGGRANGEIWPDED